jgi:hypothetical protein
VAVAQRSRNRGANASTLPVYKDASLSGMGRCGWSARQWKADANKQARLGTLLADRRRFPGSASELIMDDVEKVLRRYGVRSAE